MNHSIIKQQIQSKIHIQKIFVVIGLFVTIAFFVHLGVNKDIWFCDEVWTYVSANACNLPNIFSESRWISGTEVTKYLAAGWIEDGGFHAIAENLYTDHVPLYFWIFRIFSLIFKGSTSKWIGLSWNLVLIILLYLFLIEFYAQSPNLNYKFSEYHGIPVPQISLTLAIIAVLFHPLILSEALTIRMYLQFTVFQISFMCILDVSRISKKNFVHLLLVTVLGLLTHFYIWIWIALFSAMYIIYIFLFQSKKWIKSFYYCGNMLISLALSTLLFPYWIQNIFFNTNTKGNSSLHKILEFNRLPGAVILAIKTVCNYLTLSKVEFYFPLVIFLSLFTIYLLSHKYNYKILVMISSSIFYAIFVVYTQPSSEGRYLWPSCILFLVAIIEMLFVDLKFLYEISTTNEYIRKTLIPPLIRIFSVSTVIIMVFVNIILSMDFNHIFYLQNRSKKEHQ